MMMKFLRRISFSRRSLISWLIRSAESMSPWAQTAASWSLSSLLLSRHPGLDLLEVEVAEDFLEVDFGGDFEQLGLALAVVDRQALQGLGEQVDVKALDAVNGVLAVHLARFILKAKRLGTE